jgi:hypothetical protein
MKASQKVKATSQSPENTAQPEEQQAKQTAHEEKK